MKSAGPPLLQDRIAAQEQARTGASQVTVDAVIVAYNSRDTLRFCVEPLVRLPWVSVTVVDNASPDDSAAVVADLPVRVIRAPRNGGFAYGCNLGSAAGDAEFVLYVNPDATIQQGSLKTLVSALRSDPLLGSVGPLTLGDGDRLHLTQRRFPRLRSTYAQALGLHHFASRSTWAGEVVQDPAAYSRPCAPDWLSGSCLLVRRAALEDVGGLDEGFFLYSEETDLFRRLRDQGWKARYEPKALAYHRGYGSAPWEAVTPVLARSRVRYAHKHHGQAVALLEAIGVALDGLLRAAARANHPARRRAYLASGLAALSAVRRSNDAA